MWSLPGNCDAVTGKCHKCTKNNDGDQCEKCKPGFYGDAIDKKDCRDCKCNACGAEDVACNGTNGQCQCKPNVEGSRCNQCKVLRCFLLLYYRHNGKKPSR